MNSFRSRAFGPQGVEKLARLVVHVDHAARERRPVDVHVEDRQEDADPHGRAADEVVVRKRRDVDDRAVGRRDDQHSGRRESCAADRGRNRAARPSSTAGTIASQHHGSAEQ